MPINLYAGLSQFVWTVLVVDTLVRRKNLTFSASNLLHVYNAVHSRREPILTFIPTIIISDFRTPNNLILGFRSRYPTKTYISMILFGSLNPRNSELG